MRRSIGSLWMLLAGVGLVVSGCGSTSAAAVTGPRGRILYVERRAVPSIPPGLDVVIRPFSTDGVDLGTGHRGGSASRMEAAEAIRAAAPDLLAAAVVRELEASELFAGVSSETTAVPPSRSIAVEGRILAIDPGSHAKRYWVGFGAGRSGVLVEGRVLDGEGRLIAEFRHRRYSDPGVHRGGFAKLLTDNLEVLGKDIGKFLIDLVERQPPGG